MNGTEARHYKTSLIVNYHVRNVRFSSAKRIFFILTVLPNLYYLYAVVRNTVESSLFLLSVPVTPTPSHCSPFLWGMFTHARAHVCKWDGAFGTLLTLVLTVLSFSSELLHSICLKLV